MFPVFHNYYDDNPVGRVVIGNQEKVRRKIDERGAGQTAEIELYALFTDKVLGITEGTKAPAEITLQYRLRDEWYRLTPIETVRMYDRNAMTWDDDRKAAAFVTARGPAVMSFAKNATAAAETKTTRLHANLGKALSIHETLGLYGLRYAVDPKTPYTEFSRAKDQVDFLQFPR